MRVRLYGAALVLVPFLLCPFPGSAETVDPAKRGLEIATEADAKNEGFRTDASKVRMELYNAHGDVVKREMSIETIEGKDDGDKSLVIFSFPNDVKGTKLLTYSHKTGDDDQWLYLPAVQRIKRISSRNKSGSFMGSEFAYEDLASQEVEKYTYKFLREGEEGGRAIWIFERYPVDKRSGYRRQVVSMDKEYFNPLKIEYYDRKDELLKVGTFAGYKKYDKFWRWSEIAMLNHQTKKRSVFSWEKRKLGAEIDEEALESDALEE